jgi:hypothetical protein
MSVALEHSQQDVRVEETPHQVHVEIAFAADEPEPQVLVRVSSRGVDVRVVRCLDPSEAFHPNPDAMPI